MMILKFRKEDEAKHLLKKIKKMREEIEDVETTIEECMEDEDDDAYRYDDDYRDDDRRMRRERMNDRRYRRMR